MPAIYNGETFVKKSKMTPCPFCGGREFVMFFNGEEPDSPEWACYVHCIPCDVNGPACHTHKEAVAKWNKRAEIK